MAKIKGAKILKKEASDRILVKHKSVEGNVIPIKTDDLDKELYKEVYKGYLRCPHYQCRAKISFAERKNGQKYFSTWKKSPHIPGCPYEVKYKGKVVRSDVYEENVLSELTDDHIRNIINSTIEMINNINNNIEIDEEPLTTREVEKGEDATNISESIGKGDGSKSTERNKRVYKRAVPDVTGRDKGETRSVYGIIESTWNVNT